jgi:hypothetical protein
MNYVIPVWAVLLSWVILSFHVTHIYFGYPKGSIKAHADDHGWGCVIKGYVMMMFIWPYFMVRKLNESMEYIQELRKYIKERKRTHSNTPSDLPPEVRKIVEALQAEGHEVVVTTDPNEVMERMKERKGE